MAKNGVRTDFRVVCLGGSAGGLQAYLEIFRTIPRDTGMAFVVAPHRGIEHADVLLEILQGATPMPVVDVTQGLRIEPNSVFLMPPRSNMTLDDEDTFHLRTSPAPPGWPKTINIFLYSLAEAKG